MAYNGPTLLISGDMSMVYDTGVLGMRHLPVDFKIAVINWLFLSPISLNNQPPSCFSVSLPYGVSDL